MSTTTIPPAGLVLHDVPADDETQFNNDSAVSFRLSDDLLRDVRKASAGQDGLQFLTGNAPVRVKVEAPPEVPILLNLESRKSGSASERSTSVYPRKPFAMSCIRHRRSHSEASPSLALSVTELS